MKFRTLPKKLVNRVIGNLREVVIPLPDAKEILRHDKGDKIFHQRFHFPANGGRGDWSGQDDTAHALLTERADCHAHGRSGSHSIIDEDDGFSF